MTFLKSFTKCSKNLFLALVAAGCLTQAVAADSITTLFNSNNGGTAGGGVYFDITVGANPILITGFDVSVGINYQNVLVPFRVWTAAGTSVGNQTNAGVWTLVGEGTGIGAAAIDQPTPITLAGSFMLDANTSYGMAISLSDGTGAIPSAQQRYSGTGTSPLPGQTMYSNADLTLNLGSASGTLFGGTPFSPRIWNGTIYYSTVPAPGAMALLGIAALVGPRRRRC